MDKSNMIAAEGGSGKGKHWIDLTRDDHGSAMQFHASAANAARKTKDYAEERHHVSRYNKHKESYNALREESMTDDLDENFGQMVGHLSKLGKGVKDEPKQNLKRSSKYSDITMTGHKEKETASGNKQYSKILPDPDDEEAEEVKNIVKAEPEVKRGRGRPAGSSKAAGSYKPWSDEAKASLKAKLADRRAAKSATKTESVVLDLDEDHWAELFEGHDLDSMIEFMISEDYEQLDELSKATLGSYIKKASHDVAAKGALTRHFAEKGRREYADNNFTQARKDDEKANKVFKAGWDRRMNMAKAVDRLTKESLEGTDINFISENAWAELIEGCDSDDILDFMVSEDYSQLDELSKATLGSYIRKSSGNMASATRAAGVEAGARGPDRWKKMNDKENRAAKRGAGISKAVDRLTKESVDESMDIYAAHINKTLLKD